jgi:hypothetical protein
VTRTLRRVRHDLVLIGRVAAEPLPEDAHAILAPPLAELSAVGTRLLRALGRAFTERSAPPAPEEFVGVLARVAAAMDAMKHDEQLVALGFAFEQLQRNLDDLVLRAREFAEPKPRP